MKKVDENRVSDVTEQKTEKKAPAKTRNKAPALKKDTRALKNYVLDTNILLEYPHALYAFEEHNVYIADVTLEELDRKKGKANDVGFNARTALRNIEAMRKTGELLTGAPLPCGGKFFVELNHKASILPESWDQTAPDNRILCVCKGLLEEENNTKTVLVTNDTTLRIKAAVLGIDVEEYRAGQLVVHSNEHYTGRRKIITSGEMIDRFYKQKRFSSAETAELAGDTPFIENQFVLLAEEGRETHSALGKYRRGEVVPLEYEKDSRLKALDIAPKNCGQRFLVEALMAPCSEAVLVIVPGPAGTGKTFFALAAGLAQEEDYDKILCVRPNIKFDEEIGYLKGSEEDKIAPLMRPFVDNINAIYPRQCKTEDLLYEGRLEFQAMAFMRGRSLVETWLIVDEAQNMTPTQAFGIITRAGENTKIILAGDPGQIDNPLLDATNNGLTFASETMKGSPLCWQVTMTEGESVRSPLALEAIKRMSLKGQRKEEE